MDGELQALKRRLDAEPHDEALVREYERALLRAGRNGEVQRRLEERLTCDFRWNQLAEDPRSSSVRYCGPCERSVTLVHDRAELERYAAAGQQVAGTRALLGEVAAAAVTRMLDGSPPGPAPECFAVAADTELDVPQTGFACECLRDPDRPTRLHTEVQDTECEAWKRLVELVKQAARDGRHEFAPRADMDAESWAEIVTLPPTIAELKEVRKLTLYGSHLVQIPPEIGGMTGLEEFIPYTSYRLHWYPYEITRCRRLRKSVVSTRALYGNYKFRPRFPALDVEAGLATATCSVCDRPAASFRRVWISLMVATDVLPLLVNACSQACIDALPRPADGYFPTAHRGGPDLRTPPSWGS